MSAAALILLASVALEPPFLRLAEEAEAFARELPNLIGEEKLTQQAVKERRGFRIRVGEKALRAAPVLNEQREVQSEFAYSTFGGREGQPPTIHELRTVVAVDGRPVAKAEEARRALVLNARSADDQVKRRLLEALEKNLISGAALDFTLTLLLFRSRNLDNYEFLPVLDQQIGESDCEIWAFRQKGGQARFTIFDGKQVRAQPLEGQVWLRKRDGVPLRIRLRSVMEDGDQLPVIDDGVTDYRMSAHGFLTPVRVLHRQYAGTATMAVNLFTYEEFKRFSTESGIKFTPVEDEERPKP